MFIAKDIAQFKSLFINKLKDMLSDDELGAFILVLANSHQDEYLKTELAAALNENFLALKNKYQCGELKATADDLDVFKQLVNNDIQQLPTWQLRQEGKWEIVCNVMRKLRPARASKQTLDSIVQDFDDSKFHFNKPFLKPEILWQGEYQNKVLRVLYNKFPFCNYHLLIVVSPEDNLPQVLTEEMHVYVSALTRETNKVFPGFGIGFNSLAAGASVNHLHFQGFMREEKFPIEFIKGPDDYPLAIKKFSDADLCWQYIQALIEKNVAFNCLYRADACYVVSRKYQGKVELPDWLDGAGWIDVAGVMTVSDKETFDAINRQVISQSLHLLSIGSSSKE